MPEGRSIDSRQNNTKGCVPYSDIADIKPRGESGGDQERVAEGVQSAEMYLARICAAEGVLSESEVKRAYSLVGQYSEVIEVKKKTKEVLGEELDEEIRNEIKELLESSERIARNLENLIEDILRNVN
jgi:hypothetical protein